MNWNMRLERLKADLEHARQKAAEWQARAKDLERQITEQENLEIVQAVRSIQVSPEELRGILRKIQEMREVPGDIARNGFKAGMDGIKEDSRSVSGDEKISREEIAGYGKTE